MRLLAIKWYKRAAELGFADAQDALGNCYSNGDGVTIDEREAIKWITRAAKAGNARAQAILDSLQK